MSSKREKRPRSDFRVQTMPVSPLGRSRYRLVADRDGRVVEAVQRFLDHLAVRGLSDQTLRTYAYSLLTAWRWMALSSRKISSLRETDLSDYACFLQEGARLRGSPREAARSINLRLLVLRCAYRFERGGLELGESSRSRADSSRAPRPSGRPRRPLRGESRRRSRLHLKEPERLPRTLSPEEISRFFESFRTCRDLAIGHVMLLAGLRLSEVLSLRLEDFNQKDRELRVRGKGDKDRVLPVCEELMERLLRYLRVERPEASRAHELFVCLKGKRRGESMTRAGLRRLFRYHREVSTVENASPHRFRHTFATDLVRAGLDLPYLMELLGHEHLKTVALYTHLTPRDVRIEFDRAMRQRAARGSPP